MFLTEEEKKNPLDRLWWPDNPPLYDIEKSYLYNAEYGPFFAGALAQRELPNQDEWTDFLGFKIASRIGIPAGLLLNSRWIGLAADLGYDVLCYNTIRSQEHEGHAYPNMIYVECDEQLFPGQLPHHLTVNKTKPTELAKIAVTNSFGMPSRDREYLAADIPKAKERLHPGQAMIVSIVGTAASDNVDIFFDDFIAVAKQAKEYGATIIEANFCCSNVATAEGELYTQPASVGKLTASLVKAIGDIPLIIKLGAFDDPQEMEKTIIAAAEGGARAICGINTINMKVVKPAGLPALGANRVYSGICGYPIHQAALQFTREARRIIDHNRLQLALMSTGGAVLPEHLQAFLNEGADIAMAATGMVWDPYLAGRYHRTAKRDLCLI